MSFLDLKNGLIIIKDLQDLEINNIKIESVL